MWVNVIFLYFFSLKPHHLVSFLWCFQSSLWTFPLDPSWAITGQVANCICKICLVVGRVLCHSACTSGFREMLPRKCYLSEKFGFFWRFASKRFKPRSKNFSNIPGDWNLWEMMEVYLEPVHCQTDIAAPAMLRVASTVAGTVKPGCPWYMFALLRIPWCLCHKLF